MRRAATWLGSKKGRVFTVGAALLWLCLLGLALESYAVYRMRADEAAVARWQGPTDDEKMTAYLPVIERYQGGPLPEGPPRNQERAAFLELDEAGRSALAEARGELVLLCDEQAHVLSMYAASAPQPIVLLAEVVRGRADIKYLQCTEGGIEPWRLMQWVLAHESAMSDDLCVRLPDGTEELFQFSATPLREGDAAGARILIFVRMSIWEDFWFTFRKNIDWDFTGTATSWERKTRQFHVNNVGFRDDDVVLPKPEGVYRILCIGGSTTIEGLTNALTYPNMLEKKLRDCLGTRAIEVINCGVYGYRSEHERRRLSDFLALEPDLVVYYNFINDLREFAPKWAAPQNPWAEPVLAIKHALRRSHFLSTYCNWQLLPSEARLVQQLDRDCLEVIGGIGDEVQRKGAAFAVCSFAHPTNLNEAETLLLEADRKRWFSVLTFDSYARMTDLFNREVRRMCEARGFIYVPVAEQLRGGRVRFTDICHMNPVGIERKAEAVFQTLRNVLWEFFSAREDAADGDSAPATRVADFLPLS